jgi:hypothetical protein
LELCEIIIAKQGNLVLNRKQCSRLYAIIDF